MINDLGVDIFGLIDYGDDLFEADEEGAEITFAGFMELVLSLRGTNSATVKDFIEMRKFVTSELNELGDFLVEYMDGRLAGIQSDVNHIARQKTKSDLR